MYKLPKSERLHSRKQIAALMDEGVVLFHFPFKIFFSLSSATSETACCQIAVNVPKRNFKRAVVRNLLKRRMREAFRLNKTELHDTLKQQNKQAVIFFHYISPEILDYGHIETTMQKALAKLASTVAESDDISFCPAN